MAIISIIYSEKPSFYLTDNKLVITRNEYHLNDNSDDDLYLFEDDEVTKSEFDAKTNKYLSAESDLIIWSDYLTFLLKNN